MKCPLQVFLWIQWIFRCLQVSICLNTRLKWCLRSKTSVVNFCGYKSALKDLVLYFPLRVSSIMLHSCSGFKPGWIQRDVSYIIFLVLFDFNYFLTALLFENLSQLRVLVMPTAAWPFSTKMPFQQPPQSFQAKRNLLEEPLFLHAWKLASLSSFPLPLILGWHFFALLWEGTETPGGLQQDTEQRLGAGRVG